MIRNRWVSEKGKEDIIKKLCETTNKDENTIRILVNRNLETKEDIEKFLNPSLFDMYDPYLFSDMDIAIKRIRKAVNNNEIIFIYGDYDVDGVTASSLLYKGLKTLTDNVFIYIPGRESEGYGLNKEAIKKIKNKGCSLIITVDCGITSVVEAEYAKELGVDMIVTDHHTCPEILPDCIAVINPKRVDSGYPFSELCGAGVALKLCQALEVATKELFAIAAIGTVADIVPLVSENRIIAYFGIEYLKEGLLKNINILCDVSGVSFKDINSRTLGFTIAPRINASGRMASAGSAVEFFITHDEEKMREIALYLDNLNHERQECEKNILNEVKEKIKTGNEDKNNLIIVWGENWQEGVIGIVASRITEEYHKPCILISLKDGIGKGSSRSIKGFNIYDALTGVKDYLLKYGGHALAAGITVNEENLSDFKENILKNSEEFFKNGRIYPEIMIDCELKEEYISEEYAEFIKTFEPFGMGNPEPVFLLKSGTVKSSYAFSNDAHMRLLLKKGKVVLENVGFGLGGYAESLREGEHIHMVLTIGINEYRGVRKLQGKIKDIKLEK